MRTDISRLAFELVKVCNWFHTLVEVAQPTIAGSPAIGV